MTLIRLRVAATIVVGASAALVPLSAPAGAVPDGLACSVELLAHDTATSERVAARQAFDDHVTNVYYPALYGAVQARREHASWRAPTAQTRAGWIEARAAYRADPSPENQQTLTEARTAYDENLARLAVTRQEMASAKQTLADAAATHSTLAGTWATKKVARQAAAQALQACLDAHPAAGTIADPLPVDYGDFTWQYAALTFGPLAPTGVGARTYRVVPRSACAGRSDCLTAAFRSVEADGVLRLDWAFVGECATSSETFDIYREDTDALVASVPLTWTAAC